MSSDEQASRARIDAYLARLRRALGRLPLEEVNDILCEIRGHIVERAESAGILDGKTMERILEDMGRPEEIGSLYRTDALVARARATFSPVLILHTTIRWAMRTSLGFIAFLLGVVGYVMGLVLVGCAVLKPFFPNDIGLWVDEHGVQLATSSSQGLGPELLGWWAVPIYLLLGALAVGGTTAFLRWMLRFASRSSRGTTAPAQDGGPMSGRGGFLS